MRSAVDRNGTGGAGLVSLADVARHWRVSPGTAKAVCVARGIRDTGLRLRPTFRWKDIWRVEGAPEVAPALWDAFREPLLTPDDLGVLFPELSRRTIRRDLASGRWPVIVLAERTRRVRARDVAKELEIRAGKRPVRRFAASEPGAAANLFKQRTCEVIAPAVSAAQRVRAFASHQGKIPEQRPNRLTTDISPRLVFPGGTAGRRACDLGAANGRRRGPTTSRPGPIPQSSPHGRRVPGASGCPVPRRHALTITFVSQATGQSPWGRSLRDTGVPHVHLERHRTGRIGRPRLFRQQPAQGPRRAPALCGHP